MLGANLLN